MRGFIYQIFYNENPEIRYIGSTIQELRYRWRDHKYDYNKPNHRRLSIHDYFDKYDIKNFSINLIKEYDVTDKKHLLSKEQLWISKLKCINKCNSFNPLPKKLLVKITRSDASKERNKKYKKEYDKINKDKIEARRSEIIECECGVLIRKDSKIKHLKSRNHKL